MSCQMGLGDQCGREATIRVRGYWLCRKHARRYKEWAQFAEMDQAPKLAKSAAAPTDPKETQ